MSKIKARLANYLTIFYEDLLSTYQFWIGTILGVNLTVIASLLVSM